MELYVRFLGLDLLSLHVTTDASDPSPSDDLGECTTYPVGFTAAHAIPDEAGPYREGWE